MIWGFPEQNKDFAITTYGGNISYPLLLLDRWTEFHETFRNYLKLLSPWFWGFPKQNKDFAITTYGEGTHL